MLMVEARLIPAAVIASYVLRPPSGWQQPRYRAHSQPTQPTSRGAGR